MKSSQLFALLVSVSIASFAVPSYAQLSPEEEAMQQMELTPVENPDADATLEIESAPVVIDMPDAQAPAQELPNQPANNADAATSSINENWTGTLMFEAQNVQALNAIFRDFLMRKEVQKPADTETAATPSRPGIIASLPTFGEEPKEIPEEVLKFSLNSIVYETPADWSIWVNGQFFNAQKAREGFSIGNSNLRVIDINRNHVTYLWTPIAESFDKVQKRWEEKQRLSGLMVSTQVAQDEHVAFNENDKTVTITMRPNQTFISQFMSVLEGVDTIRNTAMTTAADTLSETPEAQPMAEPETPSAPAAGQVILPQSVQDAQPVITEPEEPRAAHIH